MSTRLSFRDSAAKPAWNAALALAALATLAAAAAAIDGRLLPNGENVWTKPLRFALAFAVHLATLGWIALITRRAEAGDRAFAWSLRLQIAAIAVEMACIAVQAARGVPSHFNHETAFDRAVFTVMGLGTSVLLVGFLLIALGLFRRPGPRIATVAVSIGMGLAILGGAIGVLMVLPTPEQRAALAEGLRPIWIGGHATGLASGATLPLFGWDLAGGDWRAPHFLGLHGMQAMALMAWVATRRGRTPGTAPVMLAAAAYGIATIWVIRQTALGLSIFAPGPVDLAVLTLAATAFLAALIWAARLSVARRATAAAPSP